jgi:hypothetical protein
LAWRELGPPCIPDCKRFVFPPLPKSCFLAPGPTLYRKSQLAALRPSAGRLCCARWRLCVRACAAPRCLQTPLCRAAVGPSAPFAPARAGCAAGALFRLQELASRCMLSAPADACRSRYLL